jgi:hypothetical protein
MHFTCISVPHPHRPSYGPHLAETGDPRQDLMSPLQSQILGNASLVATWLRRHYFLSTWAPTACPDTPPLPCDPSCRPPYGHMSLLWARCGHLHGFVGYKQGQWAPLHSVKNYTSASDEIQFSRICDFLWNLTNLIFFAKFLVIED